MRFIIYISFIVYLLSCQNNESNNTPKISSPDKPSKGIKYCNEFGEVILTQQDSSYRAAFYKNDSLVFDTLFHPKLSRTIFDSTYTKGKNVFQLKYSFIIFDENTFTVQDISSIAYMPMRTGIKNLYTRKFFRCDTSTIIKGLATYGKGGTMIDGIYLDRRLYLGDTGIVQGTIVKEKYPRAYYSTSESPQGMFGDTTIDHYRLVIKNLKEID